MCALIRGSSLLSLLSPSICLLSVSVSLTCTRHSSPLQVHLIWNSMAINAAKQLLDELMGRARDLGPNEKKDTFDWNDPMVCKHFLVNFCPNSLFTNTKADIGPCNLVHDDYLKREYQAKANKRERRAFEEDFIRFCQGQLNEVERKIKRAKQRLESSQLERSTQSVGDSVISEQCLEKLNSINEKIEKVLEEIEQLGCQGKVEEAQEAMKLLDQLKEKKASLKRENHSGHWIQQKAEIGVAQEKQMEVCDVCGAFLIVNDVQQRVEDHLQGKQHVGYGRLKSALEDLVEKRNKGYAPSTEERSRHDRGHRKGDSRGRFRERDRYQEHRGRAKDYFKRSRSRSRSPDKSNHRAIESPERRRSSHFNSSTK